MTFATYDFETFDWVHPFVFCVYTKEQHSEHVYRDEKTHNCVPKCLEAMEHLASRDNIKTFWAHNGGKFDVLFIVDAIKRMPGWKCDGITASGRVISLRVMSPTITFELKDSYAVIQSSLAKALESFEIPRRKTFTAADYSGDMRKLSDVDLLAGCLADCESLYLLLERAQSMFEGWGGQLKSTFSSSALTLVKAHVGRPLPSHEGSQWANDICRRAYCGGRVEVFTHAPGILLREYDVVSSYPWSMTQELPWQLLGNDRPPQLYDKEVKQIVYATVNVPEQYLPPLPFVPPSGGLFFPFGKWSAWFVGDELKYAIEYCGVTARLHEAVSYSVQTPFKSFIDTVFETKATATGAKREFAKLVMNGCYGKFGQKPENTKLKVFASSEDGIAYAREHMDTTAINKDWTALEVKEFRWPKHTHYAMASHITAYSRIKLHKLLMLARDGHQASFNQLAYCDTDSIHVDEKCASLTGYVSNALGDVKVELEHYTARYFAPKLYTMLEVTGKEHFASKGFPVNAEAFKRIIGFEKVGNEKGRMQLIRTQLRKGGGVVHLNEQETLKLWSGRSNKRRVLPGTKGETMPWTAAELVEGIHVNQKSPIAKAGIK